MSGARPPSGSSPRRLAPPVRPSPALPFPARRLLPPPPLLWLLRHTPQSRRDGGAGPGDPRLPPALSLAPRRALPERGARPGPRRPPLPGSRPPQLSPVRRQQEARGWGGRTGAARGGGEREPRGPGLGPGRTGPGRAAATHVPAPTGWVGSEARDGTRPPRGAQGSCLPRGTEPLIRG